MSTFLKPAFILAAIVLMCGSAPALADEPASRNVSLQGLVLSHPEDASIAYRRIHIAARQACREEHQFGANSGIMIRRCTHRAVSDAISQLNVAELSAIHNFRAASERLANVQAHIPS